VTLGKGGIEAAEVECARWRRKRSGARQTWPGLRLPVETGPCFG
jgi:hypothetical protein